MDEFIVIHNSAAVLSQLLQQLVDRFWLNGALEKGGQYISDVCANLQFADTANGNPVPESAVSNIDLWTA